MIKAILFDYGGTLDTNARHWAHVIREAYDAHQLPVSEEPFREAYVFGERALAKAPIVKPHDDFYTLLFKKIKQELAWLEFKEYYEINEEEWPWLVQALAEYCDRYAQRHIDRTKPTLQRLAGRLPLALVSNFYGNLPKVVETYGIKSCFKQIVESAVVGVRKPDPQIFALGAKACGVRPEETIVVGDSYTKDIIPAAAIGCHTVWMKGEPWKQESVDETVPDKIITDFLDLEDALADIENNA